MKIYRKRVVKIVKELVWGFILVVYLTSGGILLWSKIVRSTSINYSKYTITNKYEMSVDEANLAVY